MFEDFTTGMLLQSNPILADGPELATGRFVTYTQSDPRHPELCLLCDGDWDLAERQAAGGHARSLGRVRGDDIRVDVAAFDNLFSPSDHRRPPARRVRVVDRCCTCSPRQSWNFAEEE